MLGSLVTRVMGKHGWSHQLCLPFLPDGQVESFDTNW